jgi:hypothetical protein
MPNTPGVSNAEAMRAKLLAEQAAKAKAREMEDAAALKALEEQIAKEAAAAELRAQQEAMALVRAEKRKAQEDAVEVVEVSGSSFAIDVWLIVFVGPL